MKTIYAYTGKSPAVGYVGYINVRQHTNGIAVIVRSEGAGTQGEIVLTPEQCESMACDLLEYINGDTPVAAQEHPAGEWTPERKRLATKRIADSLKEFQEESKYSDIVSDGGLDPRNKYDITR